MRAVRSLFAVILALGALIALAAPVRAQAKGDDAFARAMFDPQLVLRHAQEIGLTAAQRKTIFEELKAAQSALAPMQVDMSQRALELQEQVEAPRVDEAKALAMVDQVLKIENEVKKRQVTLIVRVKNLLTPEQQAKLRALRDASPRAGGTPPDGATQDNR